MKTTIKFTSLILFVMMAVSSALVAQSAKVSNNETMTYNVSMDCHSCKVKIEKNIPFEKGIKALDVDLEKKTVTVTFDKRRTDNEKVMNAIRKLGYEVEVVPQKECCSNDKKEACCNSDKKEKADCCKENGTTH